MIHKSQLIACLLFLYACTKNTSQEDIPTPVINNINTVVTDMQGSHEGLPTGVPVTYTWQAGPRIGMGNDPGSYRAMIPWGAIFETDPGNTCNNTRVEIRDLKAYYLSKRTNTWQLWSATVRPYGSLIDQDLTSGITKAADIREVDGGGLAVLIQDGFNFTFSAPKRTSIDPGDIAGVFVTVQGRLVVSDPSKQDDRQQASYMICAGGDYWVDLTSTGPNFTLNGDIGIGRFKRVTNEWRAFNMHTLSEDALRANPPPME
jgi:hypothetical protein